MHFCHILGNYRHIVNTGLSHYHRTLSVPLILSHCLWDSVTAISTVSSVTTCFYLPWLPSLPSALSALSLHVSTYPDCPHRHLVSTYLDLTTQITSWDRAHAPPPPVRDHLKKMAKKELFLEFFAMALVWSLQVIFHDWWVILHCHVALPISCCVSVSYLATLVAVNHQLVPLRCHNSEFKNYK